MIVRFACMSRKVWSNDLTDGPLESRLSHCQAFATDLHAETLTGAHSEVDINIISKPEWPRRMIHGAMGCNSHCEVMTFTTRTKDLNYLRPS